MQREAAPGAASSFEPSMTRPPILDPQSVPVLGTDAHLSAVPGERLRAEALRRRFGSAAGWEPEIPGDGRLFADRVPAHASVLVPLVIHWMLKLLPADVREHAERRARGEPAQPVRPR